MKQDKKVLGDVESFVVDRSKWYRGKGPEHSALLNSKGEMCCLGFYARAAGLPASIIRNIASPAGAVELCAVGATLGKKRAIVRSSKVLWETKLTTSSIRNTSNTAVISNTDATAKLMNVNDFQGITDTSREEQLTAIFKGIGINIKFVG